MNIDNQKERLEEIKDQKKKLETTITDIIDIGNDYYREVEQIVQDCNEALNRLNDKTETTIDHLIASIDELINKEIDEKIKEWKKDK